MDINTNIDQNVGIGSVESMADSVALSTQPERLLCYASKWTEAKEMTDTHPVALKLGIKLQGLRHVGDIVLIPMYDVAGTIHGFQFMGPDGTRMLSTGADHYGHFFPISSPKDNIVVITPDYLTAAAIHELTGHCVLVAFEEGNLLPVAEIVRRNCPGCRVFTTLSADIDDIYQLEEQVLCKKIIEDAILVTDVTSGDGYYYDNVTCKSPQTAGCDVVTDKTAKAEANKPGIELGGLNIAKDSQAKGILCGGMPEEGVDLVDVVPSPDPVDPVLLLYDITSAIKRFVACSDHVAVACALWINMTWFIDVLHIAPLAAITAPEKRCGKSTLLSLIGRLSRRAVSASNITSAALFRVLSSWKPTLLLDEADTFLQKNKELWGVLNCGHTRNAAYIIRVVEDKPTKFCVFGAKAISGIGGLPDTILDRSIVLELRRKLPDESIDRLRYAEPGLFEILASKLARFAVDKREQVRTARPDLPETLNDRAQDNWEPLLAIADVVGGEWPVLARQAAMSISGFNNSIHSTGTELLLHIHGIFSVIKADRIFTKDLIKELCMDEERQWASFNRGRSISPRQVSAQLHEYGIDSRSIRIGSETAKGFLIEQFEEAFHRYLQPTEKDGNLTEKHCGKDPTVLHC